MKYLRGLVVAAFGLILVSGVPLEKGKRLIKTSADKPAIWMTEQEIWKKLIGRHRHFIDITDHLDAEVNQTEVDNSAIPTTLKYSDETRGLLAEISSDRIESFIKTFTSYYNRYYTAKTGTQSQKWLLSQVQESIQDYVGNASVNEFHHTWSQCSIIARIEGSDPDLKSQVIVLGAHQDSINMFGRQFRAPGADDNAAGSVVVLESLRAIVNAGFIPKRTIEFHWYAAEEVGLRGSAAVAQAYRAENVKVVGMVNFDVPGYHNGKDEIGIYTDNTDPAMNDFLRLLTDEYLTYSWKDDKCGYGCSDHASWTRYGYPSAMPAEATLHPMMHTPMDDATRVSYIQIAEFVKLALGVCGEFGEPAESDFVEELPTTSDTPQ